MIDLWGWTYEKDTELRERGLNELADYMDALPDKVHSRKHEYLDSTYDWAIDEARAHGEVWVEIFLRHWRLQDWVMDRGDLVRGQPEAASLLEFATRGENRDCPQSMCVIQDFCRAVGGREGPTYAQDRIQIIEDCFKEINPKQSCYECLALELTEAYRDAGDLDALEAFFHKTGRHVTQGMDPEELTFIYFNAKSEIAVGRGQYADALKWLERIEKETGHYKECWEMFVRARKALCFAKQGDAAKAIKALGKPEQFLTSAGELSKGCEAAQAILEIGDLKASSTKDLTQFLIDGANKLAELGMSYNAISIACLAVPLVVKEFELADAEKMMASVTPEIKRLDEVIQSANQTLQAQS